MGGDLPTLDAFTKSLLTNQEVLEVDQASSENHELFERDNHIAWTAKAPGTGERYLAIFNLADGSPASVKVQWKELGLKGKCAVRDLWQNKDLGTYSRSFAPKLNPHGAGLYKIRPKS